MLRVRKKPVGRVGEVGEVGRRVEHRHPGGQHGEARVSVKRGLTVEQHQALGRDLQALQAELRVLLPYLASRFRRGIDGTLRAAITSLDRLRTELDDAAFHEHRGAVPFRALVACYGLDEEDRGNGSRGHGEAREGEPRPRRGLSEGEHLTLAHDLQAMQDRVTLVQERLRGAHYPPPLVGIGQRLVGQVARLRRALEVAWGREHPDEDAANATGAVRPAPDAAQGTQRPVRGSQKSFEDKAGHRPDEAGVPRSVTLA